MEKSIWWYSGWNKDLLLNDEDVLWLANWMPEGEVMLKQE